jgi:broad specificity phosphatase PhoE
MHVYFVRHGESEANLLNVFSNRGVTVHGLTPRGRQQVEALATQLSGVRFGSFFSSPIRRATESADILARHLNVKFETTEALREYDVGVYEGRGDDDGWREYDRVRDAWVRERRYDCRMDGGESFNDICARFMPLIDRLRAMPDESPPAILLGHGGVFGCMLPLIFSNVDHAYALNIGLGHTDFVHGQLNGDDGVCLQWGAVRPSISAS